MTADSRKMRGGGYLSLVLVLLTTITRSFSFAFFCPGSRTNTHTMLGEALYTGEGDPEGSRNKLSRRAFSIRRSVRSENRRIANTNNTNTLVVRGMPTPPGSFLILEKTLTPRTAHAFYLSPQTRLYAQNRCERRVLRVSK